MVELFRESVFKAMKERACGVVLGFLDTSQPCKQVLLLIEDVPKDILVLVSGLPLI